MGEVGSVRGGPRWSIIRRNVPTIRWEQGTTGESGDSEDSGLDFVDFGTIGEGTECIPTDQNCEEGLKCVWYIAEGSGLRRNNARCIPVTGDRAPFEACSLPTGLGPDITDDCGSDTYCLEVYGTADHGYCAPFAQSGSCENYPGTSAVFENGSAFPAACLLHPCHPLDSSTCPQGTRCMYYPASLYANAVCWSDDVPADLPLGAACDYGTCGDGRLCAPSSWLPDCEHDRCCTQWCDVQAGTACGVAGTTCGSFHIQQANDAAFDNVGACLLPDVFER